MSYYEIKQKYKKMFKKYPAATALYNEKAERNIRLTTTRHEITEAGTTTTEETENISFINYFNIVSPETVSFFRSLGGREKVTCKSVVKYGVLPVQIESTSPDRKTIVIRKFEF